MKNFLILFCFISAAATCQDRNSASNDAKENPCPPDVICTMEFKIVNLEIVNNVGEPVKLDQFYTEIDAQKIEIPDDVYESKVGTYPVATDGQMEKIDFEGSETVFVGFLDGKKVVEHKMTVGKDCCHIRIIEGKRKLTLN